MALTSEELENLSDLLLSVDDDNTKIAFEILSGQEIFPEELITEVFVVYKLTDNELLKEKALKFLVTHNFSSYIITARIHLKSYGRVVLSEKTIKRNINEYIEMSDGQLDGIKMGLAMYNKYKLGLNYLLDNLPNNLNRKLLRSFVTGTRFELKGCDLTKFPPLLYEFTELTEIDLSENKIKIVPAKIKAFEKLEFLNVSNNNIGKLNSAITKLPNLKKLDISHNNFTEFPEEICGVHTLEELKLNNLNILFVGESLVVPPSFYKLPNLKKLTLSSGNYGISQGIAENFFDYPSCSTITSSTGLNLNPLELAEYIYTKNGRSEGVLYLFEHSKDSQLIKKIIDEQFYDLETKTLGFKCTLLKKLPKELQEYKVKHIDMGGCSWGIPFYKRSDKINRHTISFTEKELEEKLQILTHYKDIRTANLSYNRFSFLPKAVLQWKFLKKLNLNNNQLSSLPIELQNLQELEELFLYKNEFKHLPKCVTQLKNLKILSLAHNKLNDIPKELGMLENLEEIYLNSACQSRYGDSDLFTIPESFKNLRKLKKIQFYESRISYSSSKKEKEIKQYYQERLQSLVPKDCKIRLEYV